MQVFVIAPVGARPLWLLIPVGIVLVVVISVLAISVLGARGAAFEVSASTLRVRGDLYGRTIPLGMLKPAEARRVDVTTAGELRPTVRMWGTGLPGYQSGWFRLANGERALVYLTDRSKAVHVPTAEGYSLLLSPDDPDGFLAALQIAERR